MDRAGGDPGNQRSGRPATPCCPRRGNRPLTFAPSGIGAAKCAEGTGLPTACSGTMQLGQTEAGAFLILNSRNGLDCALVLAASTPGSRKAIDRVTGWIDFCEGECLSDHDAVSPSRCPK